MDVPTEDVSIERREIFQVLRRLTLLDRVLVNEMDLRYFHVSRRRKGNGKEKISAGFNYVRV